MKNLKIAVYTICKNESKFVDTFMNCVKHEADAVYVTDTGSTDDTVEKLKAHGAIVNSIVVNPWRFDDPRNISLSFVPMEYDVCVCIDLDEILTVGWRLAIERSWIKGHTTRLRYQYAWSHDENGDPATTFWYDKIHQRKNYRWVKPVHEVLQIYNQEEVQTICDGFMLHHWPDQTKSRGSYLGLLELAVKENLNDDRSSHYLGREYMFHGMYEKSIEELKRHLSLESATWNAERCASMRFISRGLMALGKPQEALQWAFKACVESPIDREPWVELARSAYAVGDNLTMYYAAKKAIGITERPMSYICEPFAWGYEPYDYLSIAAWRLGHKEEAIHNASIALSLKPNDTRLKDNYDWLVAYQNK
jgi:glycosyltransferase involved in cell wall biosynthesis